jgi:uncharacterized protein YcbK (DUF882 family)
MTKPAGRRSTVTRRHFLAWGSAGVALGLPALAMPHIANAATLAANQRKLAFANLHTGETLKTVYWEAGDYVPGALGQINHILRDFRTNDVHQIDAKLLDLLNTLHQKLASKVPFSVISGYRSPKTNAVLAEASNGVAKHSLHMEGQAIDIHLEDVALTDLHRGALALKRGGVGYYPASDFVHVDVGRVRTW